MNQINNMDNINTGINNYISKHYKGGIFDEKNYNCLIKDSKYIRFYIMMAFLGIELSELCDEYELICDKKVNENSGYGSKEKDSKKRLQYDLWKSIDNKSALDDYKKAMKSLLENKEYCYSEKVNHILDKAKKLFLANPELYTDYSKLKKFIKNSLMEEQKNDVTNLEKYAVAEGMINATKEAVELLAKYKLLVNELTTLQIRPLKKAKVKSIEIKEIIDALIEEIKFEMLCENADDMMKPVSEIFDYIWIEKPKYLDEWKLIYINWEVLKKIFLDAKVKEKFLEVILMSGDEADKKDNEVLTEASKKNGEKILINVHKYSYIMRFNNAKGKRIDKNKLIKFYQEIKKDIDDIILYTTIAGYIDNLKKMSSKHFKLIFDSVCIME